MIRNLIFTTALLGAVQCAAQNGETAPKNDQALKIVLENGEQVGLDEMTDRSTLVKTGDEVPDFEVELFDGRRIRMSDLRGKVVVVNFWATWCPPCRAELARVQKEIIDRFTGEDFVFLPISRGEKRETVAKFRGKTGYTFAMGLDPEAEIFALFAEKSIPRNFVIDRQGRIVAAETGYAPALFDELLHTIEQTLNDK